MHIDRKFPTLSAFGCGHFNTSLPSYDFSINREVSYANAEVRIVRPFKSNCKTTGYKTNKRKNDFLNVGLTVYLSDRKRFQCRGRYGKCNGFHTRREKQLNV